MITIERRSDGFSVLYNGTPLLGHAPGAPMAYVGRGSELVEMYRGNFDIQDRLSERVGLAEFEIDESGPRQRISLFGGRYRLDIALGEEDGRLSVEPTLSPAAGDGPRGAEPNRFWFRLPAEPGESVFGGGEQFSHLDLRGRRFPLWTSEQGVGRNKRTRVTWEADVADKAGGDYWWTFFPQATFASSRRYWMHADCPAYAALDFRDTDFHELEFWALPKRIFFGVGGSMLDLAKGVSALLGRQPEPPDWTHDGIVLGMQGGTAVCERRLRRAKARGVPVAGIWAQDWEGINMTGFG
ncbi:MAG: alpha-glucosidase, partial [Spirochaetes bacterium]|nr:alpha-glucosidase [Spirochaetota bacterium]